MLSDIPTLLDDISAGRMVILMDDEDRENEGDLIIAAEKATPARSSVAAIAVVPNSLAVASARSPSNPPIGVRAPSTISTSDMALFSTGTGAGI